MRRAEIAALTPSSFSFDAPEPYLTVSAAVSKHRKKDILPIHPELLGLLRGWITGLQPDEPLFPKLKNRKTWLMVKKDLAAAEIPHQTADGIADFHAAGRHTFITELLRNGVSIPEAKALARHSDVNMTMRYTHIGLADQTEAIAKLPSAQRYSSDPGVVSSHQVSQPVTTTAVIAVPGQRKNPGKSRGFDINCPSESPSDTTAKKRRARGSFGHIFATSCKICICMVSP